MPRARQKEAERTSSRFLQSSPRQVERSRQVLRPNQRRRMRDNAGSRENPRPSFRTPAAMCVPCRLREAQRVLNSPCAIGTVRALLRGRFGRSARSTTTTGSSSTIFATSPAVSLPYSHDEDILNRRNDVDRHRERLRRVGGSSRRRLQPMPPCSATPAALPKGVLPRRESLASSGPHSVGPCVSFQRSQLLPQVGWLDP